MYTYGWFILRIYKKTTKFCKAIILQLKNKSSLKNIAQKKKNYDVDDCMVYKPIL